MLPTRLMWVVGIYHPWGYGYPHQGCSWKTFLPGRVGFRLPQKKKVKRWTVEKSNWPENDLFVTGCKTWRGWWFFHKITRMLMIDVLMAIHGVFGDFLVFGVIFVREKFWKEEGHSDDSPLDSEWCSTRAKKVEWHSIKLQTLTAPNVVSDELLVFSNFYTTNYPSTTNWFLSLQYLPSIGAFFPGSTRQGWCIGRRYKGFQQSDGRIFHTIKTRDVFQECATLQKTNGWNPKNAGLEDDSRSVRRFCFLGKVSDQFSPFSMNLLEWSKALASFWQNAGICLSRHQKCIRWGNPGWL